MMNEGVALAAVRRILHLQQQLADTRRQLADLRRRLQGRAEGPGDGQTPAAASRRAGEETGPITGFWLIARTCRVLGTRLRLMITP
jgi:hypothetical protein